jgi:hypothetical protein
MSSNLDDMDFTKLCEVFDPKKIKDSPLLSDAHDDTHYDSHDDGRRDSQ